MVAFGGREGRPVFGRVMSAPSDGMVSSAARFCAGCGSTLPSQVAFCPNCGRQVGSRDSRTPDEPMPRRRRRWRPVAAGLVVGALLVVLVVGAAATVTGLGNASRFGPAMPSPPQQAILDEFGQPPTWWLADGPTDPGAGSMRIERWIYPEQGIWIDFVDGVASEPIELTLEPALLDATSPVSPTALDRGLTPADVADALQTAPQPLESVPTPFGDLAVEAFADVGLVVVYLDGYFYAAQTM